MPVRFAVPLFAHVLPLTDVVPLTTLLDACSTANASARQWRRADFAESRRLLPPMVIGIATGAALLVRPPRGPALFALGNRVHFALSRNGVISLIAVLLVVNGGLLVARAFALLDPS